MTSSTSSPKTIEEFNIQAAELRQTILEKMAKDGGHVSSPLGVIELIQALMTVYDFTKDKITFDVGHQMHAYKLLTDRAEVFETMDIQGGIGEYANIHESPYDFYTGGHSGTAISAALGYSVNHPEYKSIALIGDGSMTGGQPYEALNQAGEIRSNILVIYNDNDYSVTENTGFLHSQKRLQKFSESLGFEYVGVADGHNTLSLIDTLRDIQNKKHPVFLHVKTLKGKGYKPAEDDPVTFHWLEPFDLETGRLKNEKANKFRDAVIETAQALKEKYSDFYMVSPAAARSSGLKELKDIYPNYVFDTGMNEQHCITFSAGLALNKNKVVCFLPATFLPRALDQLIDVCLLKVPMVFVLLNTGIGATGPTHQGVYTFPTLNMLPNAELYNPSTLDDFTELLEQSLEKDGPVFIQKPSENVELGDGDIVEVSQGERLTVLAIGNTLKSALRLAENIKGTEVLYAKQIVPIDIGAIRSHVHKTGRLLILEDGLVKSGIGQHIVSSILEEQYRFEILGVKDVFPRIGTLQEVYKDIGLSDEHILNAAKRLIGD